MGKKSRNKRQRREQGAEAPTASQSAAESPQFERAAAKLEEARRILELLAASTDFIGFRAQFNAFLSASRAITFALQKEGSHVAGFEAWYAEKQDEMRNDELLRYMHTKRTGDFHEGDASLALAGMYIDHFSSRDAGPAPEPGATMEIGAAGINWVLGAGTARERRVPVTRGGSWQMQIALLEAPTVHLGNPMANAGPHAVCSLTLSYFEALVHEARTREWVP